MRQLPENLAQGQAGVYTVAAQLLLRGHNPSFPAVDIGYDLIADGCVKVQVKCAHLTFSSNYHKTGCYAFKLATRTVVKAGRIRGTVSRVFSEECDFVALWGIEENRFWIIPAAVLDNKMGVYVGPKCSWVDTDLLKLREAKEQGKTYRQIAQENNINLATAYNTITGKRTQSDRTFFTDTVRGYEGCWNLISEYAATMNEANVAADSPVEDFVGAIQQA
jgi:hypothetical protein